MENVDNGESNSQGVALLITNQNGEKVYRWSHDKGFLTVIVDAKLRKYERLSFSEIWDYKDNEGNRVLPGKYTITVKIPAKLKDIGTFDLGELKAAKDIEVKMTMIFATAKCKVNGKRRKVYADYFCCDTK
ncbi:BsuPI-related putative proteinase inhibitor [Desulfosporosinus sp. I2]|uniref:BsuPI-related putative proteinase inhibitor n=1 Tax=Desulfosporosinus sp. I2 TaxID=1617025 RepID=UPI001A9A5513|nr:BsuPI-related putative proteinase inhibitor [Desulfosporosinus sp. I2]